jgi:hypothetical protein
VTASVRAYKKADRQPCGIDGCGQPLYCKGMCVMHYSRSRTLGHPGAAARKRQVNGTGGLTDDGYRVIKAPGHPLATAQDKALEHRVVLFAVIGDGIHGCHWCGKSLTWRGHAATRINVDHLDFDRLHNVPSNLVPSCLDCNTKRRAVA